MNTTKTIRANAGLCCTALLALGAAASADAALITFNVAPGNVTFDASSGRLDAVGTVIAADGVAPGVIGQGFSLAALLGSYDVGLDAVAAQFGGVAGEDDLEVTGFLTGELSELTLFGAFGLDFGVLTGSAVLAGPAASAFGGNGALLALQFNMSTAFAADTFGSDFSAAMNGQLEGVPVPEPTPLALAIPGLLALGWLRGRRTALTAGR
jgi:hypothetical protein